jgi:hypothetical protein
MQQQQQQQQSTKAVDCGVQALWVRTEVGSVLDSNGRT